MNANLATEQPIVLHRPKAAPAPTAERWPVAEIEAGGGDAIDPMRRPAETLDLEPKKFEGVADGVLQCVLVIGGVAQRLRDHVR